MNDSYSSHENVLVITFGDDPANDKNAYLALTDLKQLDSQGQIELVGAGVVSREPDGQVDVRAELGQDPIFSGAATGGVIGLLVGIIGGPLGVLLGGSTGLLVGSIFDADGAENTASVLADISKQVQVERPALLAQVAEPSSEVIDAAIGRYDGTVLRRSLADVEAEIAAAEDSQRQAAREARKQLRAARLDHQRQHARANVNELKSKLHRPQAHV